LALRRAFELFDDLEGEGLVVLVDGRVVAFSIFSRHIDGTCLVNFEKADHGMSGLSQYLNRVTAERLLGKGCLFVNREQDLGIPGLRKSKRSYDPDFLLENYSLIPRLG